MNSFDKITEKIFGPKPTKLESATDQSMDEQKLVAFVRQELEEARSTSARLALESVWMTNTAYLMGFDGVSYDVRSRQYKPTSNSRGSRSRNRINSNKILALAQNRQARLCKSAPKYDVKPESNSVDDKDAARLGIEVINQVWDRERINERRIPMVMQVQQFGYAFMFVNWDDCAGKPMVDPQSNEIIGYEGDVRIDVASPFEVYTDPLAKTLDECTWLTRVKVRRLEYFRDRYPEKGHLVKEEAAWLLSTQYEMRINSLSRMGQDGDSSQQQMKNAAIECIRYEKPSKKHPNGRMIVTANGILLEDKELPVGEIPCAMFCDVMIGGRFAAEATITHLRPLQDYKNLLLRKRNDWVSRVLAGKYIAAKGHGMMAEALNNESGEVLEYNPVPNAAPPQPMQIPQMPAYVYQEDSRIDGEMNSIMGIGEISQGTLPSAGIPAVGMQFLQEQDETRIGIVTEQHEHAYARIGQLILKYVGRYYNMPRMLKSAGEGLDYCVKSFTGADLRSNYDVRVIRGSTLPGSKILKRQEILNAYQQGLLGQPGDPKLRDKVLGMLEFGDVAEIFEDVGIDQNQIKEQIRMIEREEIPPRSELDNHELHFIEKNRYRKTDKFKALSPVGQRILLDDIEYHVQEIINLNNPQVQGDQEMAQEMMASSQSLTEDEIAEKTEIERMAMMDGAQQLPPEDGGQSL